ncbi:hypothetical protein QCA50_013634 [Cerrena zonata]|uniref:Peptidase M12A domain-containing protein n=1 Tax=Cerrena zonata TaxID=2478898 RepID=A0AAW0FVM0_9APHY
MQNDEPSQTPPLLAYDCVTPHYSTQEYLDSVIVNQCRCTQLANFEPFNDEDEDDSSPQYSVSLITRLWDIDTTITFSFLNGSSNQHMKVLICLNKWLQHSNVQLEHVPMGGDVRIKFSPNASWSYVGTNCKTVHGDRPTMQLGGIDESESSLTTSEMRTILHECGHMLGFVHEHQSPTRESQVTFDKKATVSYYADTWSPSKVERSVLRIHLEERLAAYSPFDDMSIMLYEIPACTNSERRHIARPSSLSPVDAAFATLLYPPSLSPNLPLLKHSLAIAGVPPCRQLHVLNSDSPQQFRSRFMTWNREARVAYSVVDHPA